MFFEEEKNSLAFASSAWRKKEEKVELFFAFVLCIPNARFIHVFECQKITYFWANKKWLLTFLKQKSSYVNLSNLTSTLFFKKEYAYTVVYVLEILAFCIVNHTLPFLKSRSSKKIKERKSRELSNAIHIKMCEIVLLIGNTQDINYGSKYKYVEICYMALICKYARRTVDWNGGK